MIVRLLRWLGAAGVLLFAIVAFSPLASVLNGWMAGRPQLGPADAIVVVGRGGADADGVLTNRSLRRTLHGIALYRRGLAPLLVFSGGLDETGARADLARGFAVAPAGILTAPGGRTTREEAAVLGSLLQRRGIRRVLLVADPIDMPRTRDALTRAGFTVLSAPTASSGPGNPESRLGLTRDIAIELAAWVYSRLTPAT